jgi:hypothetical protein
MTISTIQPQTTTTSATAMKSSTTPSLHPTTTCDDLDVNFQDPYKNKEEVFETKNRNLKNRNGKKVANRSGNC